VEEEKKVNEGVKKAESQGRMQEERLAALIRHGQEPFDMERPRAEDVRIPHAEPVDYGVLRMDAPAQGVRIS
jgi:hypothetical protein